MESVLCGTADCSLDLLNRELQRLQSSMPKEKNNHLYTANSIWYKDSDENFVPADDFLKLNAEFYQADIFASAFDKKTTKDINRWIDRRTDGMTVSYTHLDVYKRQYLWSGFDYIGEPTPYHTRNSYFGQIDTAGFPKDSYYLYQACLLYTSRCV